MRRALFCTCLVTALLLPTTAWGATRHFSGTTDGNGGVSFSTTFKKGKTKKVKTPLKFTRVPIACDDGIDRVVTAQLNGAALKVRRNEFSFRNPNVEITGKFTKKGRRASGTFSDQGTFNLPGGGTADCDTGLVHWSAKKTR